MPESALSPRDVLRLPTCHELHVQGVVSEFPLRHRPRQQISFEHQRRGHPLNVFAFLERVHVRFGASKENDRVRRRLQSQSFALAPPVSSRCFGRRVSA